MENLPENARSIVVSAHMLAEMFMDGYNRPLYQPFSVAANEYSNADRTVCVLYGRMESCANDSDLTFEAVERVLRETRTVIGQHAVSVRRCRWFNTMDMVFCTLQCLTESDSTLSVMEQFIAVRHLVSVLHRVRPVILRQHPLPAIAETHPDDYPPASKKSRFVAP